MKIYCRKVGLLTRFFTHVYLNGVKVTRLNKITEIDVKQGDVLSFKFALFKCNFMRDYTIRDSKDNYQIIIDNYKFGSIWIYAYITLLLIMNRIAFYFRINDGELKYPLIILFAPMILMFLIAFNIIFTFSNKLVLDNNTKQS